ncbi:MAG TPA: hypothetical protein PKD85_05495 [Saprospiraceae bacterium]|nr:hypothetical protein [Saprospiraceae bacterium]
MSIDDIRQKKLSSFKLYEGEFLLFDDINHIGELWDQFTCRDLYFSAAYLNLIQNSISLGIQPYYLIELRNVEIANVYYYQLKTFNLNESLRSSEEVQNNIFKKNASKLISFDTLVNGNLLLTGKYGVYSKDLEYTIDVANLEKINDLVCKQITTLKKSKPGGFLIKDFYKTEISNNNQIKSFSEFVVHPNMILEMPISWNSMNDYTEALNTKYRTRYKRAIKKLYPITERALSIEDLIIYKEIMYKLYSNIALNADFNLFQTSI